MVAGQGQGHPDLPIPLKKFSRLHRREKVGLVFVAVDGKMAEFHPGDAGNGIGVFRRRRLRLAKDAPVVPELPLVFAVIAVKHGKILVVPGPHQGEGVVLRVKGGVQGCQRIVIARLALPDGHFERFLFIQAPGDQPQVHREKFQSGLFDPAAQPGHVHMQRDGISGGRHPVKIAEDTGPGPAVHVQRCEFHGPSSLYPLIK